MPENDPTTSQLRHPSAKKEKHGLHRSRTYSIWQAMRQRVHNPKRRGHTEYYEHVSIAPRWDSFINFLADMGECPEGKSLDRHPNPEGNYEPSNCRWATATEQQRNRRDNIKLTFKDQTKTIWEWAEITGIHVGTIASRIKQGLNAHEALTRPVQANNREGRLIAFNGKTMNTSDWARETGIPQPTIWYRLNKGWPVADILRVKER